MERRKRKGNEVSGEKREVESDWEKCKGGRETKGQIQLSNEMKQ